MSKKVWIADRWRGEKTGTGLRWQVVWIDPDTKREKSKSFKKKADADRHQTFIEHSLRSDTYLSPEVAALTVADAAEAWMKSKKRIKPAARRKYRDDLDNYALPRWGHLPLSAVKRPDIEAWISDLADGTAPRRADAKAFSGVLSPASIDGIFTVLNASFRYAVREGWIRQNPATGVETPKAKTEPVIFLTHPELEALIDGTRQAGNLSDAVMVAVMGNIGLRPGEAVALDVADVDIPAKRIYVSKTVTLDDDRRHVIGDSPKTAAGIRAVPIPPHLLDDLNALTEGRDDGDPLFTSPRGDRLNLYNWRARNWTKAKQAAGAPAGLTPKGLRHTAASLAIAAGADVLVVQRMLGHASATETLNTYAKLWPDRLNEVTAAMSRARTHALSEVSKLG
ncbi:tyrosine-type recombinase/integrase [Microbacterium sp. SSW1-49]|uniref:Tyrosine-type recombinase/integrase n=1 Tax=Microbacterium croceum TaxID=2851645 RepID=A0ABT0FC86_9MICO|nr:tyrosine-type recombinase/integrase [Microbacterium croceum]MCK2035675.1 tyrosine-type recombinase/integrase [Microbacterium croceum]